ncbi:transposase-like protein [Bacillus capparidis]|uniref:Mutator family transposase n=1 Tax=Bacillus capparidis TaxID=1840411 RepID=A0ABS4D044_9BACI|nr:transposase-like protein [Bacillus capparidis]
MWKELLLDLKDRGVEEILLFISDGLKGITDSIFSVYPDANYQTCCVHLARNIAHKVRVNDRPKICYDFKSIYRAESAEAGREALKEFCTKWQSAYPKVTKSLSENHYIFTFYSFPKSIWKSIYSTNLIESFNKQIKKYTKRKEQFPNEEAMERFLVSQFDDYNHTLSYWF